MAAFRVSAPGKVLFLGGYSVLERPNLAYVVAVNAFVHATVEPLKTNEIVLSIPQFKVKINTTTEKIFNVKNKNVIFVLNAITTTLAYFKFKNIPYSGFSLMTKSDKQFSVNDGKSGLGSSAAVCVATVSALFEAFGLKIKRNKDEIHKVAQFAHSNAQGKAGSGFDIAAACYGSIQYIRFSPQLIDINKPEKLFESRLDCEIKPIKFPAEWKLVIANFPKQSMSTVNAVKKMLKFKRKDIATYDRLIHNLNVHNYYAVEALRKKDIFKFQKHVREGREITKKLGQLAGVEIESDKMTRLIEESERNGAFAAKLPGAGGGDSIIALCDSDINNKRVKKFWKKNGLEVLDVDIINEGAKANNPGLKPWACR